MFVSCAAVFSWNTGLRLNLVADFTALHNFVLSLKT
jgi:hypothetical protein